MNDRITSRKPLKLGLHDARASTADREWLTNVYPFYLHDLSEFDEHYYTLNHRGLWEPDHLPSWLEDDTDHPLIIRQSETPVGFALVNQAPSVDMMPGFRFRLAEFFILKRYRRSGIGLRAAQALFDRFRGRWYLSILARNAPAIAFWRKVLGDQPDLHEQSGPRGEIIYTFDTDSGKTRGQPIQIRRAEAGDEEALARIRQRAILALAVPAMSREQAEKWATGAAADRIVRAIQDHDVWVALDGAASGWVEVDRDRVAALYVSPSHARRGVGSALLARAETSIRSSGYATARLESSQNALDFYLRRGYVRCGPPDAAGAYPMLKDLAVVH